MRRRAFTLTELLIVIAIIGLISAVALPTVLPALQHRQVSESARLVQAAIEGARDSAIRAGAPRGIRLLPDPTLPNTSNRIVPIEPAGQYTEGRLAIYAGSAPSWGGGRALRVVEVQSPAAGVVNPRTSWYWNVRVGDKLKIGGTGLAYTIVGPITTANPEGFVNVGEPGAAITNPFEAGSEYLFLVNGRDDDGNGWQDEGKDGVNNDDPASNTLVDEDAEWEVETWLAGEDTITTTPQTRTFNVPYTIERRPYLTPGVRPTDLPSNVVIDLSPTGERSRLPVDATMGMVDILVTPNGTVIPTTVYSSPTSAGTTPFLHIWIAERSDVYPPEGTTYPFLPLPEGTTGYTGTRFIAGESRIVTVNMKTGMVTTVEPEVYSATDPNRVLQEARMGVRATD